MHSLWVVYCLSGCGGQLQRRYNLFTSNLTQHISEDHILQEELNKLTHSLLAGAYPLHLIIKNIKKALTHNRNNLLFQRTPQSVANILSIITTFSDIGKLFTATIHKNWHTIANDTTLHYLVIQALISLYQIQQHYNHHVHSAQAHGFSLQDS